MPFYEYKCIGCDVSIEEVRSMNDTEPPECVNGCGKMQRVYTPSAISLPWAQRSNAEKKEILQKRSDADAFKNIRPYRKEIEEKVVFNYTNNVQSGIGDDE